MLGGILQTFAQLTSMEIHVNNNVDIHDMEIIIVVLECLSACVVLPQIFACAKLGKPSEMKLHQGALLFLHPKDGILLESTKLMPRPGNQITHLSFFPPSSFYD